MLNIIYAGTPEFAVPALESLIDSDHQVVAVYTQPDRPSGRGRKLQPGPVKSCALRHGLPVLQPESFANQTEIEQLAGFQADLMVVVAYGLLLPVAVLNTPRLGCINIHASLLPKWRGAAPIQRAIEAGDETSGVTIMQMDKGLDTGDMLASARLPIAQNWNSADLHDQLKVTGAGLLVNTLEKMESGELVAQPQDGAVATYAAKLSKQEAKIDWNQDAETIERQVRAFNPWPVSFTRLNNENLRVWGARVDRGHLQGSPGEVIEHNQDGLFVGCRASVLKIFEMQFAGKKRCSAAEISKARNLSGLQFE